MKQIEEKPEVYLSTAARMLDAEGMSEASSLLRSAHVVVEETGFDNWNGGTRVWTVFLEVSPERYAQIGSNREVIEEQIHKRIEPIVQKFSDDWFSVTLTPRTVIEPDWRELQGDLTKTTRRNIVDGLIIEKADWSGSLNELEFLGRLFDLEELPSNDHRFETAAGDIWQHRINNDDWDNEWIYTDRRLNLLGCPAALFLRFLCEMIHPVVRPDRNEALKMLGHFNDQLRVDGWELVEQEKIAGRPRFVAREVRDADSGPASRARSVADALDAGWMQKEIERLENAVDTDPALAIGTAKELIESCCKSILEKREVTVPRSTDLPKLTKMLSKELSLAPEGISDEARGVDTIKRILQNLSALTHNLAELRGMYGTGHGRDGQFRGLQPRHARLAVGAAVAFIDFVTATHGQHEEAD